MLSGAIDSTLSRIDAQLNVLKEKTQSAQQRRQEVTIKQIQKVAANIFPKSNFQEREFNVVYLHEQVWSGFREVVKRRDRYRPVPASTYRPIGPRGCQTTFSVSLLKKWAFAMLKARSISFPAFGSSVAIMRETYCFLFPVVK